MIQYTSPLTHEGINKTMSQSRVIETVNESGQGKLGF